MIDMEKAEVLIEDLKDEVSSANEYMTYSFSAEDPVEKKVMYAIAKDEYTHAMYLHDYLSEHGVVIPEQIETMYKVMVNESWKFCQ